MFSTESSFWTDSGSMSVRPRLETVPSEQGVVAHVGEELGLDQAGASSQVSGLPIQVGAVTAPAEDPAEEVLLGERRGHQGRRNGPCVVEQVHVAGPEPVVGLRGGAGADRHDEELVLADRPAQAVGLEGGHEVELEGLVGVHGEPAVDEDELVVAVVTTSGGK